MSNKDTIKTITDTKEKAVYQVVNEKGEETLTLSIFSGQTTYKEIKPGGKGYGPSGDFDIKYTDCIELKLKSGPVELYRFYGQGMEDAQYATYDFMHDMPAHRHNYKKELISELVKGNSKELSAVRVILQQVNGLLVNGIKEEMVKLEEKLTNEAERRRTQEEKLRKQRIKEKELKELKEQRQQDAESALNNFLGEHGHQSPESPIPEPQSPKKRKIFPPLLDRIIKRRAK